MINVPFVFLSTKILNLYVIRLIKEEIRRVIAPISCIHQDERIYFTFRHLEAQYFR